MSDIYLNNFKIQTAQDGCYVRGKDGKVFVKTPTEQEAREWIEDNFGDSELNESTDWSTSYFTKTGDEIIEGLMGNASDDEIDGTIKILKYVAKQLLLRRIESVVMAIMDEDIQWYLEDLSELINTKTFTKDGWKVESYTIHTESYPVLWCKETLPNGNTYYYFKSEYELQDVVDYCAKQYDNYNQTESRKTNSSGTSLNEARTLNDFDPREIDLFMDQFQENLSKLEDLVKYGIEIKPNFEKAELVSGGQTGTKDIEIKDNKNYASGNMLLSKLLDSVTIYAKGNLSVDNDGLLIITGKVYIDFTFNSKFNDGKSETITIIGFMFKNNELKPLVAI